jgi:hypothetical protein
MFAVAQSEEPNLDALAKSIQKNALPSPDAGQSDESSEQTSKLIHDGKIERSETKYT